MTTPSTPEPAGRTPSATIRDVAERAGVSHQTVSRYLRFGGDGVRPAYRERIGAAIAELGYRPNLAARAMRTRHTRRLAVLLPEGSAVSTVEVLRGATTHARAAGFTLDVVALGGEPQERRARALELVGSGLFQGVLSLTPLGLGDDHPAASAITEFGLYDDDLHGIGPLATGTPVEDIVEGLAARGHRRFLHLAGSDAHESARRRRDAYLAAIARLGLHSHGVVECRWEPELARDAITRLPPDAGVTAVVAANDTLALGAIRGATERGWSVPDDLAVTGFDTDQSAEWMTPSLTSVAIDHAELGRRACAHLLGTLQPEAPGEADAPVMAVVWRESTSGTRTPPAPA